MARINPVSWKTLVKKLKKFGFDGPYPGGKHPYMIKGDIVLTLPNPHRKEIGVDPIYYLESMIKPIRLSSHAKEQLKYRGSSEN